MNISLAMTGTPFCGNQCNGVATVNMIHATPPYSYSWNTSPAQTTATATHLCPGKTYKVTIKDLYGQITDSITVTGSPTPPTPSICGVTVDSLSDHNIIFWDNSVYKNTGVDSFYIFREITTNNYQRIGKVAYDSLSLFIDTVHHKYFPNTGNPNNGTYRYKLSAHDSCGILGDVSLYHNTVYINSNNGTFSWNLYSIENSQNPVTGYLLLRDDNSTGNWHSVAGVSGTQQTVTDPAYASYKSTASWRIETQWNISCSPNIGIHKMESTKNLHLNASLSNIYSANRSGINLQKMPISCKLAPVPVKETLFVEVSEKCIIEVMNIQGEVLNVTKANTGNTKIDVSALSKGIYFVRIKADNGILVRKFIRQ
jgi:hypothetical protein